MADNVLIFCANSINGGTALVMAQTVMGLQNIHNLKIIPCVNAGNNVEIYKILPGINYLDVKSEEQVLGKLSQNIGITARIIRRIIRTVKYNGVVKQNIKVFKTFLLKNKIDSVLIHNGGYVGDELCNQLLQASNGIVMKHRIMVFHSDFLKSKIGKIRYAKYDRQITKWATELVTVSQFTRKRILDNSYIKKDLVVIYNGLSEKRTLSEEQKNTTIVVDKNICNIGMIGNFQSIKGHLYLLEAFKKLKEIYKEKVVLSIIGNIYEPDYFEKCKDFIIQNNLSEDIRIYHQIYNASEYCNLFDFIVVPSLCDESFGLTACESMIAGKPCIVTAKGGLPEVIVDNEDGFVIPIDNTDLFAEKMLILCNDNDLRKRMGITARKHYLEKYTLEKMVTKYEKLLI